MLPTSESEVTVPSLESSYARMFGMIQPARKAGDHTGTVTVVNTAGGRKPRNGRRLVVCHTAVMPAKAKAATAELRLPVARAVRRHRQISTPQAKSGSSMVLHPARTLNKRAGSASRS
jgi:hypothetical protein